MKIRNYDHGITFFTTKAMYEQLKAISDKREIALSELLREAIRAYLKIGDNKEIE